MRHPSLLCVAALVAATVGGGVARGQEPGPPEWRDVEQAMAERRAQEAKDLRTVLRLRPDQEAAFASFQAALGPSSRLELARLPKALTTPERLAEIARQEAEHAAKRERRAAALKAFYAALSPEQQQVFDAVQRLRAPLGPPPTLFGHPGPDRVVMVGPPEPP